IYASNPVASVPDQAKVRRGLARDDLFTVVIDNFQTDTVDYADLVLPSTMQTEHADLHYAYGHIYLNWNEPAVAPPADCLPTPESFRRRARRLGVAEPRVCAGDDALARAVLDSDEAALAGITLERLKRQGWVRLNVPTPFVPFANGFPTPSGRLEFFSPRMIEAGLDPVPTYTPPYEAAVCEPGSYPLALIAPASHYLLNSMFANVPELERRQGAPSIVLHPDDAASRGLRDGDAARVYNDRGEFRATVRVSDHVRVGVAAASKGFWPKRVAGAANANATVAERDSAMGGGAVFHDNRVEVTAARGSAEEASYGFEQGRGTRRAPRAGRQAYLSRTLSARPRAPTNEVDEPYRRSSRAATRASASAHPASNASPRSSRSTTSGV